MAMAITTAAANSRWSLTTLRAALPSVGVEIHTPTRVSFPSSTGRVSCRTCSKPIASFSGLCPLNPIISTGLSDYDSFEHNFTMVDNGCRYFAMRHGKRVPKLNRPPDQRRALLRGLTTQLLKHGRIKTTRARASAMRKYVDKMITLAKEGSLHKRRQALGFVSRKNKSFTLYLQKSKIGMGGEMVGIPELLEHCLGEGTTRLWHTLNLSKHLPVLFVSVKSSKF